jgi:O-antigen/teichoic acid export membrane protein
MGEKWEPAIFIIQALAAVIALQTLGSLVQPLAMALGQTKLLFIRSTQMLALRLPIVMFGLYIDGLRGLVLARIATGLIGVLVDMLLVKRFTGLTVASQLAVNLRALLSVTAMVVAALLLGHTVSFDRTTTGLVQEIATVGTTCALLYCLTTLVLWQLAGRPLGPEAQIIELARNIFRRLGFSRGRSA